MPQNLKHHKPVRLSSDQFEHYPGGDDPAQLNLAAHRSAHALVRRGRQNTDPQVTARLIAFTDEFGLEAIATLWQGSPAVSLPGALWRMYAIRDTVHAHAEQVSRYYERGMNSNWISRVVSGVADPPTQAEIVATADQILTGAYTGEFDIALERFAAFCRVVAAGEEITAASAEPGTYSAAVRRDFQDDGTLWRSNISPSAEVRAEAASRASSLRFRAKQLQGTAAELEAAAAQWRAGNLD